MKRAPTSPPMTLIVTARSEIILPQEAPDAINASPGDLLRLTVAGEALLIRCLGPGIVKQTAGSLQHLVLGRRRRTIPRTTEPFS